MASPEDIAIVQAAPVSFDLEAWEEENGQYAQDHWRHLNYAFEIKGYKHMFTQDQRAAADRLIAEYEEAQDDHRETYRAESDAVFWAADAFARQYIGTALWTGVSYPMGDDRGGSDSYYDGESAWITPKTLREMIEDCDAFQRDNVAALAKAYASDVWIEGERYNASNAGHDFWLTRNGHGVGFWDRGLGEVGETLSEAARKVGEYSLALDDNGEISRM
ncbi:hypothetical protein HOU02_gp147 [Caulobacter phage CcrBL9]|uniref:Uncharacterized protein n=1 Tax=Caulobacter phage CcrBL9 TaxID=2283270 RepID=A0A385EDX7_9CAUD|nr:hypothetical protein HOU02_gp038 [Caulobacter phage CcrBL9]YP_009810208.1 hypothetical protein HOU02_gp147 [Caulobacter phage CcrBL9]AXQ69062.1 hypothetical protein CcrBL9_gp038 [Caulobacter phage CcrBL9]AXQ69578.1 hypothetical protein CcrBL9_gp554 [Caulobacter phage CcrBL9]